MKRLLLASFLTVTSIIVLPSAAALAHDGWDWIMQEPRYVDRVGVHCCSTDCFPADQARFQEDNDGITFDGGERLSHRERGIYWSHEPNPPASQRWWVCRRNGRLKCIFRPQHES